MKKIKFFCSIYFAIFLACSSCFGALLVHFIDVGQGECILIQMPENKNVLIDAGNFSVGHKIETYLKSKNIFQLDYIIITHMHPDHMGGIFSILPRYRTNTVFYNGYYLIDNEPFLELLKLANDLHIHVKVLNAGSKLVFRNVALHVLSPLEPLSGDLNADSIVIKIVYREISFLLTGDLNIKGEKKLIEAGYDLKSDVLKIGHHGAEDANSEEFIDKVRPKITILSVGKNNRYGYPSEAVIQRFISREIPLFRTDFNGTIVIQTDGEIISIEKERE